MGRRFWKKLLPYFPPHPFPGEGQGTLLLGPSNVVLTSSEKQDLTLQGRIGPTRTGYVEQGREGLGRHKCGAAVSLRLCTQYNKSVFRRKCFFYQMP